MQEQATHGKLWGTVSSFKRMAFLGSFTQALKSVTERKKYDIVKMGGVDNKELVELLEKMCWCTR